jgi:hypothetical protein
MMTGGRMRDPASLADTIGSVAVGITIETILASFSALTLALLYFDLQARPQLPERQRQEYQPVSS